VQEAWERAFVTVATDGEGGDGGGGVGGGDGGRGMSGGYCTSCESAKKGGQLSGICGGWALSGSRVV